MIAITDINSFTEKQRYTNALVPINKKQLYLLHVLYIILMQRMISK